MIFTEKRIDLGMGSDSYDLYIYLHILVLVGK